MLDVRRSFITLSCSKYEWRNSANKDVKNTNIKSILKWQYWKSAAHTIIDFQYY